MIKNQININILRIFELSFEKVYSIQFPLGILPLPGLKFCYKNCTWEIKNVALFDRANEENIWDCIIISTNSLDSFTQGNYSVDWEVLE